VSAQLGERQVCGNVFGLFLIGNNIQSSIPRAMRKALTTIGTQPPKYLALDLKKKRATIEGRTTRDPKLMFCLGLSIVEMQISRLKF
jgi:hypothetical protein